MSLTKKAAVVVENQFHTRHHTTIYSAIGVAGTMTLKPESKLKIGPGSQLMVNGERRTIPMTDQNEVESTKISIMTVLGDIYINIEDVAKVEISIRQAEEMIEVLQNCIEVAKEELPPKYRTFTDEEWEGVNPDD